MDIEVGCRVRMKVDCGSRVLPGGLLGTVMEGGSAAYWIVHWDNGCEGAVATSRVEHASQSILIENAEYYHAITEDSNVPNDHD